MLNGTTQYTLHAMHCGLHGNCGLMKFVRQPGRQAGYIASVSVRACALMWTSERAPLCICSEYNAQTAMAKDRSIISPEPEKKEPFSFYAHLILVVVWYFYTYRRFTLSFRRCVKMNRKYNNNTYLRSFITAISVFNLPHYLRLTLIVFIVTAIFRQRTIANEKSRPRENICERERLKEAHARFTRCCYLIFFPFVKLNASVFLWLYLCQPLKFLG